MSNRESASQRAVLTAAQREVLVWVSRGEATAAAVEAALARRGQLHTRRGVQRILRRMCLRGFLKAVWFCDRRGHRCHYHIVLPAGRAAYVERERLFPAPADAPQAASEQECPPPDWALRAPSATRPTQVTLKRIVRLLEQYAPQWLSYLPLAVPPRSPAVPSCLWAGDFAGRGAFSGLSSQWVVGVGG